MLLSFDEYGCMIRPNRELKPVTALTTSMLTIIIFPHANTYATTRTI
jgi:hypothetical protein